MATAGSDVIQRIKTYALPLAALLLSGCVQYDWYKDGASFEQKERQVLACEAASLKALPPNFQTSSQSTQTTGSTNCEAGVKNSCGKKNKVYTQTDYQSSDVNEDARWVLVKDCMYQQGWRQIEISH